jgi:hypothetical protein
LKERIVRVDGLFDLNKEAAFAAVSFNRSKARNVLLSHAPELGSAAEGMGADQHGRGAAGAPSEAQGPRTRFLFIAAQGRL